LYNHYRKLKIIMTSYKSKIKFLFVTTSFCFLFLDSVFAQATHTSTATAYRNQVQQSLVNLAQKDGTFDANSCLDQLSNVILLPEQMRANAKDRNKLGEYKKQIEVALSLCSPSSKNVITQYQGQVVAFSDEAANLVIQARDRFKNAPFTGGVETFFQAIRQVHALILQAQAAQAKNQHANDQESEPYTTPDTDASGDSSIDFGSYRLSPVHIVDATLPSGNDITDASVFGQYAVSSDLSNLLQQKAAAKRMLYARGYVPQPHKPLFVFSSTMTQCSNVDVLPEIASEILSLGGQLVVVANCGYFFYPKGVDTLLELRDSYSRTLKIYTNSYTISLPFRDTAVSNLDMIFFAADYMITAETSPTTQNDASLQTQVFPTVESALIHWQSLHGE
jgi:hypothetical protein